MHIKTAFVICFCVVITTFAQRPQRPEWNDNGILVNHVGFTTKTAKFCMLKSSTDVDFDIVNAIDESQAFAGTMKTVTGDFATYALGDFSPLLTPETIRSKRRARNRRCLSSTTMFIRKPLKRM